MNVVLLIRYLWLSANDRLTKNDRKNIAKNGEKMDLFHKVKYILNRKQKIRLVMLVGIIFIGGIMELLGISAIMPFVNVLMAPDTIHTNQYYSFFYDLFHLKSDAQFLFFMALALVLVYVVKNIYLLVMYDIQYRFTFNNQRRVAYKLMDAYMKQTYLFHVSKNISELNRNVTADVNMFFQAVLSVLQLLTETIVCLLLGVFLFVQDKSITIGVVVLLLIFAFFFLKVFKKKSNDLGNVTRSKSAEMGKWIRQSFEGIKEVKILNREQYFLTQVDENYTIFADAQRKNALISIAPRPIFEAVCVSALMIVVALKIIRGVNLDYFIPIMSVFAMAAFRLLPSFGRLTAYINEIVYNKVAVDNVYHDLKEVEQLMKNNKERNSHQELIELHEAIRVRDVCFKYPTMDKYVLEEVSLDIPKNKSVAFVGPSGAGKTTLADVILGVLEPESGHVYADDIDVYEYPYGWHKNLGYIPQAIYLMDDSIRNNILFGVPENEANEEAIWHALEDAQLKEFVDGLEQGIDTVIGERGVRLSGGQRQRIGIARALYNDPAILILDEATSALDNETETAVMDAINGLQGKKTLIIIAHRLSTIENCDLKYEVKDGKVLLV